MRIGTRGSELATTQTATIAGQLRRTLGEKIETVVIQTLGDRVIDRPLRELEGRGYFTKEIEEALLAGSIDLAVHSFKDMPSQSPPGLTVAAVSAREDPADLIIMRTDSYAPHLGRLPLMFGVTVGTSAVRRETQLRALRPDLAAHDLRGNVPTRVSKLVQGHYDAILLASAGVRRLNLTLPALTFYRLDPTWFVPSPGQGALAIQMRADDPRLGAVHAAVNDSRTATATALERAVQAKFGGGCGLPLGAYAQPTSEGWHVYGFWGADTERPKWASVQGSVPERLADELFQKLSA